MVKELYQIHTREINLNITNGVVDSVRKKNIVKSGCRVYENGCIGVAGTLGEPTEETWKAAEEALGLNIACPKGPAGGLVRSRSKGEMPEEKAFIAEAESILATLKAEFPRFILSNKMMAVETTVTLKNDAGLDLRETVVSISAEIVVKDDTSPNVFDSFITYREDRLDGEVLLDTARQTLSAHENLIPMPEGDLPVILSGGVLNGIAQGVNGMALHKGASLFSGKIGEKLFDEKFSFVVNRDAESGGRFFDAEGTTLPEDRIALIDHGVLVRGTADKKCAAEFSVEQTASAGADYDDVPSLTYGSLDVLPTGSLEDILGGGDAICILMASGGDTTPAGDYATPVQTAYLMQGGRLTARVPEFNFSGSIFDLFGSGYLGCVREKLLGEEHQMVLKGSIR